MDTKTLDSFPRSILHCVVTAWMTQLTMVADYTHPSIATSHCASINHHCAQRVHTHIITTQRLLSTLI